MVLWEWVRDIKHKYSKKYAMLENVSHNWEGKLQGFTKKDNASEVRGIGQDVLVFKLGHEVGKVEI